MTAFYKQIDDGYITGIGENGNDLVTAISETEYNELLTAIRNRPTAEEGYAYLLRADTLEWELVELPPEPEPDVDPSEALDYLFGGEN